MKEEHISLASISKARRPRKKDTPPASPTRSLDGSHSTAQTSGSTSKPKHAPYEYENSYAHLLMMHPQLGEVEGKKILSRTRGNLQKSN
eukprot:TRINITY_DN12395_c0_g1_i1.p1 TRINITY_DN12395_c0_g1~~TRINITY_DN12395_c0_g1_i1.p1  ORF type:complete len:89 (+),score=13.45 TRINITY_DN12395_c0_g1_i1:494-760(+)